MKTIDLTGKRFARLLVLDRAGFKRREAAWRCRCDCGNVLTVGGYDLRSGSTQSCGCLAREMSSAAMTTHNATGTPEHLVWKDMIGRCRTKGKTSFENYGGRGIVVCDRWIESFENFLADMGPRPSPVHSIDRKDNDGPYSPDNCRWGTRQEQMRNTRRNVRLTAWGETKCLAEWAGDPRCVVSYDVLKGRAHLPNWTHEQMLTRPSRIKREAVPC